LPGAGLLGQAPAGVARRPCRPAWALMSVPKTLVLPAGVTSTVVDTSRGPFAALVASAGGDRHGHVLLVPGWTGSKEDFAALLPLLADAGFDVTAYDQRGQYETPGA